MTSPQRMVLSGMLGAFEPERHGPFLPFYPGVEILPLYGLTAEGRPVDVMQPSAALLRYQPGASVPAHRHRSFEHILVLQGSQSDEFGTYERGTCVISPPGTRHAVRSDQGCVVLAIWNQSVELGNE